jgi:hypothetical protein
MSISMIKINLFLNIHYRTSCGPAQIASPQATQTSGGAKTAKPERGMLRGFAVSVGKFLWTVAAAVLAGLLVGLLFPLL